MITARKAELYLLLIAAIWGLTFPLVGSAVKAIKPLNFVCIRFFLAALVMLPFVWRQLKNTNPMIIGYGVLLGLGNLGSYGFQSLGLKTLSSGESAFITSTAVILVPIILLFLYRSKPKNMDFICAAICLFGIYILTGCHIINLQQGEIFTFLCAAGIASTIILTDMATCKIPDFKLLVFYQILFTAICAMPFCHINNVKLIFDKRVIFALFYCVLFATVLVFYLQMKYQKYTSAAKAALIFCAEPIFAILFSWIFFAETVTLNIILGGVIILLSIGIPDAYLLFFKKQSQSITQVQ